MSDTQPAPPFFVLLGPDYSGKSSALAGLAAALPGWRFLSVDDAFLDPAHALITRLRRQLVKDVLPSLGSAYSPAFAASLMQTAVVFLRDQILAGDGRTPVVVDSYYYKILAKCRLAGDGENPMFAWWRSFPQPRRVLYLEVAPRTAWRRSGAGERANRLEHYGERPGWASFEAFQTDLHKVLLDEVRHLPVTVIRERHGLARTVHDIGAALTDAALTDADPTNAVPTNGTAGRAGGST